jgi:hypothetical protein
MGKFVVIRQQGLSPQRIEAESVTYEGDSELFVFKDSARKPVAWVPKDDVLVVAQASAVGNP